MEIQGQTISLVPYTRNLCQEFYKFYVADPCMWNSSYVYEEQQVNRFYDCKVKDPSRCFFAIVLGGRIIGEIQLKHINLVKHCGTLSIHLQSDSVKGKGYGTEAEKLMVHYALQNLKLNTIFADTVRRNQRSRHVLEKIGFQHIHDDESFCYYVYKR